MVKTGARFCPSMELWKPADDDDDDDATDDGTVKDRQQREQQRKSTKFHVSLSNFAAIITWRVKSGVTEVRWPGSGQQEHDNNENMWWKR